MIGRFAAAYFGGAIGALANSAFLLILGRANVLSAIGVSISPTPTWEWIAPRLLWGSLWGLGYPLIAGLGLSPARSGLLLSLAPSAAQLFYFFPQAHYGLLGLSLGSLTPAVVIAANGIWGWVLARVVIAGGGRRSLY